MPPLLFAQPFVSADPDVVFERAFLVRQMAKLHGFHHAIYNHGRTEAGPQSKEQHLSTLVAPKGLHRGIVHDSYRTVERSLKVKSYPSASEVIWLGKRSVFDHQAGIADREYVILPIPGEFLDTADHLLGRQCGAGWKFTTLLLSCSEDLHVRSADINHERIHAALSAYPTFARVSLFDAITLMRSFHDLTNDFAPSS